MQDLLIKPLIPHYDRLARMREALAQRPPISLNTATWWASHRTSNASIGCLMGYYIHHFKPRRIELEPVNFLEQIKSQKKMGELLEGWPNSQWRHHTLHYRTLDIEAWGMNALCLYFQLREWDARRLFTPVVHGMTPDPSLVLARLDNFIRVEKAVQQ